MTDLVMRSVPEDVVEDASEIFGVPTSELLDRIYPVPSEYVDDKKETVYYMDHPGDGGSVVLFDRDGSYLVGSVHIGFYDMVAVFTSGARTATLPKSEQVETLGSQELI
jgi:hypothetical protein